MPEELDLEQEYLGTGWAFPIALSVRGGIQFSTEEQKVRESIWIILRTGIGERVYRPDFGSRLSELAFSPLNSDTLLMIRLYVLEALETWEPRISDLEVYTEPDPIRGKVGININYRLQDRSDTYNYVYPFYLLSAAG